MSVEKAASVGAGGWLKYFVVKKLWLINHIWIGVKLWYIHLNLRDILVWNHFSETHAVEALCLMGDCFASYVVLL